MLQVVYNHACALFSLGQRAEAIEKLETARSLAGFASQQKIITAALESIKVRESGEEGLSGRGVGLGWHGV